MRFLMQENRGRSLRRGGKQGVPLRDWEASVAPWLALALSCSSGGGDSEPTSEVASNNPPGGASASGTASGSGGMAAMAPAAGTSSSGGAGGTGVASGGTGAANGGAGGTGVASGGAGGTAAANGGATGTEPIMNVGGLAGSVAVDPAGTGTPMVVPALTLPPISFVDGGGVLPPPPVTDIVLQGNTLFGIDQQGCIRSSTAQGFDSCPGISVFAADSLRFVSAKLGLAASRQGDFYAAVPGDASTSSPDGVFTVPVGGTPTLHDTDGSSSVEPGFDFSSGFAIRDGVHDGTEEIYVLDRSSTGPRIRVFDVAFALRRTIPVPAQVQLAPVTNLAVDASGALYVITADEPHLARLTPAGELDAAFTVSGLPALALLGPADLALDGRGYLFVAYAGDSTTNGGMQAFNAQTGAVVSSSFVTQPAFVLSHPTGVVSGAGGELYVLDNGSFSSPADAEGNESFGQGIFIFNRTP